MDERQREAIGFFQYAHSYAQSAVTLEYNHTKAAHWNAPIYFLYFHAIELYLKAFLVRAGTDPKELKNAHGHRVRPLSQLCQRQGLQLNDDGQRIIDLMADSDSVISSRYIRVGIHTRLHFDVYSSFCLSLHRQVGSKVFEDSGVTRMPVLDLAYPASD